MLIQVEKKGQNQPVMKGESEHMQDQDLAQQIEDLIEVGIMDRSPFSFHHL